MRHFAAASALALMVGFTGCTAAQAEDKPLMRDFIGINGHTIQFNSKLYQPTCALVRDYHGVSWDTGDDTSQPLTFPLTRNEIGWKDPANRFGPHQGRVNWKELYGEWQKNGFEINVCLMFGNFTIDKWDNPTEDAYRYGKEFAKYFGPSGKHKLVTSVEIGNEPAGENRFSDEAYMTMFRAMARGIREGDPKLTILTCTASADPGGWSKHVDLFKETPDLYDVINVHKYAQPEGWPTWRRTFPEDPDYDFLGIIQKTIDWRDQHAPDKEVWITEFGYDATTKTPKPEGTFAKWTDVTDKQQAQWIVRSFLCFAEMDLGRTYLYWFNDNDTPSTHASSGITRGYLPKPSYWAMSHLYQSLGDYRFSKAVREEAGQAFVYEFTHGKTPSRRVWVVWSPTGSDREAAVELELPGRVVKAERMPLSKGAAPRVSVKRLGGSKVRIENTESPAYLWIE